MTEKKKDNLAQAHTSWGLCDNASQLKVVVRVHPIEVICRNLTKVAVANLIKLPA